MKKNNELVDSKLSYQRIKAELCVYYGPTKTTILSGFSVDLSAGGLYIKTNFPLKVNEELKLVFSLPEEYDQKPVSCRARIAWVNSESNPVKPDLSPGVGVEFIDIPPEDLASITNFLEINAAWQLEI